MKRKHSPPLKVRLNVEVPEKDVAQLAGKRARSPTPHPTSRASCANPPSPTKRAKPSSQEGNETGSESYIAATGVDGAALTPEEEEDQEDGPSESEEDTPASPREEEHSPTPSAGEDDPEILPREDLEGILERAAEYDQEEWSEEAMAEEQREVEKWAEREEEEEGESNEGDWEERQWEQDQEIMSYGIKPWDFDEVEVNFFLPFRPQTPC